MAGAVIFEIQKAGFEISAIQTVITYILIFTFKNFNYSLENKGYFYQTKRGRISRSLQRSR